MEVVGKNGSEKKMKNNEKPDVYGVTNEREPTNNNNPGYTNDASPLMWPDNEQRKPLFPEKGNRLDPDDSPDDTPTVPSFIDENTYQQKKKVAQTMMDVALLSANLNQLRCVLMQSTASQPYFYFSVTLISLSILLQVAVGAVGVMINWQYDLNDKKKIYKANKINNFAVLGIFLIIVVNVTITSFGVATPMVMGNFTGRQ